MATRAERMQQRLRGAQRHQVDDLEFGSLISAENIPATAPEPSSSPSLPSKKSSPKQESQPSPPLRRSPRNAAKSPEADAPPQSSIGSTQAMSGSYPEMAEPQSLVERPAGPAESEDLIESKVPMQSQEPIEPTEPTESAEPTPIPDSHPETAPAAAELLIPSTAPEPTVQTPAPDDLEDLPKHSTPRRSIRGAGEEVSESPANAPGSGHRRSIGLATAIPSSSARLQHVMSDADIDSLAAAMNSSSPLTRKSRMRSRETTRLARASRLSRIAATIDEVDELSSGTSRVKKVSLAERVTRAEEETEERVEEKTEERAQEKTVQKEREIPGSPEPELPPISIEEPVQPERASHVIFSDDDDDNQPEPATNTHRRNESPELHSEPAAARMSSPAAEPPRPVRPAPSPLPEPSPSPTPEPEPRRKRPRQPPQSPASPHHQRKPAHGRKKQRTSQTQNVSQRLDSFDDKTTIPIAVQRFAKTTVADAETEALANIPCTSRSGVNTVDVLSQVCEEVFDTSLAQLAAMAARPDISPAARKEYKAKTRTLEAFQEEVRSRLLQHTVYLDTLHALKKRIRAAATARARLRAQVVSLRAEKDQLGLRADAARDRHDANTAALQARLNMSAAMHRVDMVLATGATEPAQAHGDAAQARDAELANLEMIVAGVAEQASSRGTGGGALHQIREFNRFLERAALALEGRVP